MAETKKTTAKKNSSVGTNVPISDILYRTLHYWPWVLLSLFVCVGGGVIYLLCTPNVYTTTASMLIKDESAGNSMNNSDFADFGLFQSNTNIQNEITTLKSPDLMEEVVKRLNLDMNYYKPGRFHREVAYGSNLPVEVTIVDYPNNGNATFNLDVSAKGDVEISSLKVWDKSKGNETYKGHLNDTIQTAVGKMVVTPTTAYKKGEPVELKVEKQPVNMMAIFYEGQLTVTMSNENSTIINLVILDESTQRAQEILSTLMGVYNEQWIRDKNQIAVSTSNFINDRLGVIEGELGHVDSDISSYKSQHLIPDVQAASSMYMEQNQRISQDILALNNQLQMTRYIRSYLTAEGNRDQVLPTNTGVENSNIQSQISEYNQLILQRNSLLSKSSDKNPLVMALDDQLAALRSAIIGSVDNSIIALNTEIKNLQGSQASTTSKIASNPTQAKYLLSVERQQKVKESLYLFLLQKREENELSQAFTAYNTRIVQRPSSYGPTAPNKNKVLMGCFLLGLAIPFCVVYLIETNNTRLRGRKDVEGLSLPFLGEIPQNGSKDSKDGDEDKIVVSPESRNIINEAFRVVRTNMEFMNSTHDRANVIAMTSFNPGSGKSFLTMNLGAALAIKKKRVVVIDGDMRHGSTSAYLGSPNVGLSDYLSGAVNNLDELLVPVPGYDNFHVIPIGKVPPNPTELLESPRFAALINDLKSHCDYIMVDCPPIEVVADTQIIDKSVDRTIFVIRAGLLDRSMLPELDKLYEEKKYRNMAFILNGTRNDQGRYGYSHSYRSGYGYGYGYGYNYGEGKSKKEKEVTAHNSKYWSEMVFVYKPLSEKRNLCTLVKFIAALLVVNGHLFLFGRSQMEFMVPFMDVGACCVSLFFFFSGYGLMASFRSKGSAYLKNFGTRRLVRLIIPLLTAYCVSLIVYAWLVRPIDWQNVFSTLLWGGPYLRYSWYVTEIIVVYFLFYITMKLPIEQKHRLLALSALIVILMVSLYLAGQPIWYIESLPGFIMGILWEFYERRIGKKLTYSSVCTIAVISFCVWFVMWQWMLIGAPYLPAWRYALLAVLLANISFVVVVCAMIALSRFTPPNILPMRSFYEIYLIQNCVMILAGNISGQFFVKWSLTLFGVVVMGTLLYLINQRISTLMTPQRKVTAEA